MRFLLLFVDIYFLTPFQDSCTEAQTADPQLNVNGHLGMPMPSLTKIFPRTAPLTVQICIKAGRSNALTFILSLSHDSSLVSSTASYTMVIGHLSLLHIYPTNLRMHLIHTSPLLPIYFIQPKYWHPCWRWWRIIFKPSHFPTQKDRERAWCKGKQ